MDILSLKKETTGEIWVLDDAKVLSLFVLDVIQHCGYIKEMSTLLKSNSEAYCYEMSNVLDSPLNN